jgi:hypothetical protein
MITHSRNLSLLTAGTGLAALGLMLGADTNGNDNAYDGIETSFVFAKSFALETMLPLMAGAILLLGSGGLLFLLQNKDDERYRVLLHKITPLFAAVVMIGACFSLYNGFGPEMTGDEWNQPSNNMEKGIFGGLWGGLLAAATGTFVGHTYQAFRAKSTDTGASSNSATLLS